MRVSTQAMVAALEDFRQLQLSTRIASLCEAYLVGSWMRARDKYASPVAISDVNEAVEALFVLMPEHPLGRLSPFRFEWRQVDNSGRKTVWNTTTRGHGTLAESIFKSGSYRNNDIRSGLRPDAIGIVADELDEHIRPSIQALVCLVLSRHEFSDTDDWNTARGALCNELGISDKEILKIADDRDLGVALTDPNDCYSDELPDHLAPPAPVQYQTAYSRSSGEHYSDPHPDFTVVIDSRLESILKRAISGYQCVLLVGPPGTGKGALLRWLVQKVAEDPTHFGFDSSHDPDPIWRTPDESWSAFDLIGGLVPTRERQLEWSHGLIGHALQEDRWLILDETNRADLDKIMGPLLTWLSNQEVEIGHSKPHAGIPIVLDWTESARSVVEDLSEDGGPIRLMAGRDWRLLGTYNPQDAQRVFRFGQALTRRFVVVPVPAILPGQFEDLLSTRYTFLPEDAMNLVLAVYRAHYDSPETVLGPAVFLRMAEYIIAADLQDGIVNDGAGVALHDAVAEAYVINIGRYLASYDEATFEELGDRLLDGTSLKESDWSWIRVQRDILS